MVDNFSHKMDYYYFAYENSLSLTLCKKKALFSDFSPFLLEKRKKREKKNKMSDR